MTEPTAEEWRPIPGYERTYQVSSLGRIKSTPRPTTAGGILRTYVNEAGYPYIVLTQDGRQINCRIHRLVALAFIGPCPDGLGVRHLDGNKTNLTPSNLAYGTKSENELDKLRHGTHVNAAKTHCPQGHPYDEANTRRIPSRPTARYCRACNVARRRRA